MFSTLDLAGGYWQVELDPDDREKTAFVTHQSYKKATGMRVLPVRKVCKMGSH